MIARTTRRSPPDTGAVEVTADLVGTDRPAGRVHRRRRHLHPAVHRSSRSTSEWRITDPPDGLVILEPDFQRLYEEVAAYFLDPTGQRLVPDPRYLITGEAQPTALVQRLLDGPSAHLAAGRPEPADRRRAAQRR